MAIISGINEQQVVHHYTTMRRDLDHARSEKKRKWLQCARMYLSKLDPKLETWLTKNSRSRRFLAASWDAVEQVHAQTVAMLFPGDNWLALRPGEPGAWEDDDTAARHFTALLYDQMKKTRFKRDWKQLQKQLLVFGSAPFSMSWKIEWMADYPTYARAMREYETQNAQEWQAFMVMMEDYQRTVRALLARGVTPEALPPSPSFRPPGPPPTSMQKAWEGPAFHVDDIFNFVIDTMPDERETATRIKTTWVTPEYLKRFAQPDETGYQVYENLAGIESSPIHSSEQAGEAEMIVRAMMSDMLIPQEKDGVEVMEVAGDLHVPRQSGSGADIYPNHIATIANGTRLIRFEPSFMWGSRPHIQLATINTPPGETYGVGILEMAIGAQDLINARANQLVDVVAAVINPEYTMVNDGITEVNAISRPGKRHIVGRQDNLKVLEKDFKGVQLGMNDLAILKAELQQLTRATNPDIIAGPQKSATEIQRDAGITSATLQEMVQDIEENALATAVEFFVMLNAQYTDGLTFAYTVQDGVPSFLPVSPEMVRRQWLVEVRGSQHITERRQRIQDLLMFYNMTTSNPMTAMMLRLITFMKKVYEEMGFQDGDRIFVDEATGNQRLVELVASGALGGSTGGTGKPNPAAGPATESGSAAGDSRSEPGEPGGGVDSLLRQALMASGGQAGEPGVGGVATPGRI